MVKSFGFFFVVVNLRHKYSRITEQKGITKRTPYMKLKSRETKKNFFRILKASLMCFNSFLRVTYKFCHCDFGLES